MRRLGFIDVTLRDGHQYGPGLGDLRVRFAGAELRVAH